MPAPETQRLLKANDLRALGSKVAFNFEDLRKSCDQHIEQARAQARQIVEAAQAEADLIRRQSTNSGRDDGYADGMAQAEQQIEQRTAERLEEKVRERIGTALPALEAAAKSLQVERDRWLTDWESTAIRLCIAVAEKVIRSKLELDPELGRQLILDAVRAATGNARLQVRLNPGDVASLGAGLEDIIRSISGCGEAVLVDDPEVTPGGCVIETGHGVIDARIETQLGRIAEELIQTDN